MSKIKHLVISGGGINGLSFLGCLEYLDEKNLLDQVERITGSSVGSIIGLLYQLGLDSVEMAERFQSFSWNELMDIDLNIRASNFSGIVRGFKIINILGRILEEQDCNKKITFAELFAKTNVEFFITGTNVYKRTTEYFSHLSTPDLCVLKAIRISIAIPFLFKPVVWGNDIYMDGSCLERLPLQKCQDDEETLVMTYKRQPGMGISSNLTYLTQVQNECIYPMVVFDEISYTDDPLHVLLQCYKETEFYFNKKTP